MNKKTKIVLISMVLIIGFISSVLYINTKYTYRIGIENKTFIYINVSKKGKESKDIISTYLSEKAYLDNIYGTGNFDFYGGGE